MILQSHYTLCFFYEHFTKHVHTLSEVSVRTFRKLWFDSQLFSPKKTQTCFNHRCTKWSLIFIDFRGYKAIDFPPTDMKSTSFGTRIFYDSIFYWRKVLNNRSSIWRLSFNSTQQPHKQKWTQSPNITVPQNVIYEF